MPRFMLEIDKCNQVVTELRFAAELRIHVGRGRVGEKDECGGCHSVI